MCGTSAPCHINNEYQVLFYFNYVYMYICILFFLFFNRNKSGLGRRIKRKKIFLLTNFFLKKIKYYIPNNFKNN